MRVVLDTNVLVSAFLSPQGKCAQILRLVLNRRATLIINAEIYQEYIGVLLRPKFSLDKGLLKTVLSYLYDLGLKQRVNFKPNHNFPDPEDQLFYELALAGRADFLITGNRKHFPEKLCNQVVVVSPEEFLRKIN